MSDTQIASALYSRATKLVTDAIANPGDVAKTDEALAVCDRLGGLYAEQLTEKQKRIVRRLLAKLQSVIS